MRVQLNHQKRLEGKAVLMACVIPLCLFLAGCNDKTPKTDQARAKIMAERNNDSPTPGDQGLLPADRDLTQRVRKALAMGGDSATAKDISISTANGKVILRGAVNSHAEKASLATIARSVAGDGNVEDQLEVKPNP